MSSCDKTGLSREVQLGIEDHVTGNMLVVYGDVVVIIQDVKGNLHITHLLLDGISPKVIISPLNLTISSLP